jgi:hypothetical protein
LTLRDDASVAAFFPTVAIPFRTTVGIVFFRGLVITLVVSFFSCHIVSITLDQVPEVNLVHYSVNQSLGSLIFLICIVDMALGLAKSATKLVFIEDFQLVVILSYAVNLCKDVRPFFPRMREKKLQRDWLTEAFTDDGQEKLDPPHQAGE